MYTQFKFSKDLEACYKNQRVLIHFATSFPTLQRCSSVLVQSLAILQFEVFIIDFLLQNRKIQLSFISCPHYCLFCPHYSNLRLLVLLVFSVSNTQDYANTVYTSDMFYGTTVIYIFLFNILFSLKLVIVSFIVLQDFLYVYCCSLELNLCVQYAIFNQKFVIFVIGRNYK